MATKRDYYEILGVSKTASQKEIEDAYRRLAVQFHPDRVPPEKKDEAREKFKEISEAYAVVSDTQKRQLYDQYGHAGIDGRYTQEDIWRSVDFDSIFRDFGFGFGDMFDFFGTGRRSRTGRSRAVPARGSDLEIPVSITLEEAYHGVEKSIQYYRTDTCNICKGTGSMPGTSKKTCPICRGSGQQTSAFGGVFTFSQTCSKCYGSGEIIETPCSQCNGRGKVKESAKFTVKIPRGVDNGTNIRVRGKGEAGERGGSPGDLYVLIRVEQHQLFDRQEDDLYIQTKISFSVACLGGEIDVPTLDDKVKMKVPAVTPSNKVFRIKKRGMPNVHTNKQGDLYIKVVIDVPTKLTERQRELLRELDKTFET